MNAPDCALVGSVLTAPAWLSTVRRIVSPEDFDGPWSQVWSALLAVDSRGEPIDSVTVSNEMSRRGWTGSASLLSDALGSVPDVDNCETYARLVRGAALKRKGVAVFAQALEDSKNGTPWSDIKENVERLLSQSEGPGKAGDPPEAEPVTVCLDDVVEESVSWLWHHRAARGKITILEGDPGTGKSTLSLELAACVTNGTPMPGGGRCHPGNVVILGAEDGLADTVKPRLIAAGGDCTRVTCVTAIRAKGREAFFTLDRHIALLEDVVRRVDAALVVIDPLAAFLGRTDSHKDSDVRAVLAPLAALGDRTGAAILVVRHLNKGQGVASMYRGGGSIGIIGAARAAFLVAKDPEDEVRRIVTCVKNNLAPHPPAFAYRLQTAPNGSAYVRCEAHTFEMTADQLLSRIEEKASNRGTELADAENFLRDRLKDGAIPTKELKEEAEANGHSWATVRRAQKKLGIRAEKGRERKAPWKWALLQGGRDARPGAQDAQDAQDSLDGGHEHLVDSGPPDPSTRSGAHSPHVVNLERLERLEHLVEDEWPEDEGGEP